MKTIGVKESLANNVLLYDKCIPDERKDGKILYEHHQHFYEILIKRANRLTRLKILFVDQSCTSRIVGITKVRAKKS